MSTTKTVDLVCVGLNATDTLIQLDKFPESGSKIEYSDVRILPGGQAATTVIACQSETACLCAHFCAHGPRGGRSKFSICFRTSNT